MNLTLLGTGPAEGWPKPECGCASCTCARSTGAVRGPTAALLDDVLLLDCALECGPETPVVTHRAGLDLSRLRYVLLTRARAGASAPPGSTVRLVPVTAGDRLTLGRYDVRVLAAGQPAPGAGVVYDVTGPGGRLLFAVGTGPLPEASLEAVRGAAYDVVLLDETGGDQAQHGSGHLDLSTFPEQLRRLRAQGAVTEDTDVVAVHLSHLNPPTPELSRRLADWDARVVADGTTLGPRPAPVAVRRTLVLGGARSGKSREAERLLASEREVVYVATAYPADHDEEWAERVRRHRSRRPEHWSTVETTDLVPLLRADGVPLLVDCLTLWLTRVMDDRGAWDDAAWAATAEQAVQDEIAALVAAWRGTRRRVVAVTNEVGQGVVPDSITGRRFRDVMGALNAQLSAETEDVRWCVAGRVLAL